MDIFRFVNSKDVREHLRDIGYEFNSLEAAWLIYQCRDAAIDEKHKAWNELIAHAGLPDRETHQYRCAGQPSCVSEAVYVELYEP